MVWYNLIFLFLRQEKVDIRVKVLLMTQTVDVVWSVCRDDRWTPACGGSLLEGPANASGAPRRSWKTWPCEGKLLNFFSRESNYLENHCTRTQTDNFSWGLGSEITQNNRRVYWWILISVTAWTDNINRRLLGAAKKLYSLCVRVIYTKKQGIISVHCEHTLLKVDKFHIGQVSIQMQCKANQFSRESAKENKISSHQCLYFSILCDLNYHRRRGHNEMTTSRVRHT